MVGCSIRHCQSRSVKGGTIQFFSFPYKESVAEEWLRYCGPKTTTKHGRVCSNHFLASDYKKSPQLILLNEAPKRGRSLKPDAIPTLHIYNTDVPEAICRIENIIIDKPKALHALVTNDTELQNYVKDTKNQYIYRKPEALCALEINDTELKNDVKDTKNQNIYRKPEALCALEINDTELQNDGKDTKNQNIYRKPEALHALETNDTELQNDVKDTKNISIVAIDIPSKTVCSSRNIMFFPGGCNTKPDFKIEDSSNVKSDGTITIPLAEHEQLKKTAEKFYALKKNLEKIFSSSQMRCFMKPDMRRVRWSDEDIAAAVSLRRISPEAYRHMRVNVGIPLPAFSTVRKWIAKFGRGKYESLDAEHNYS